MYQCLCKPDRDTGNPGTNDNYLGIRFKILRGVYKGQLCNFRQYVDHNTLRVSLSIKPKMIAIAKTDLIPDGWVQVDEVMTNKKTEGVNSANPKGLIPKADLFAKKATETFEGSGVFVHKRLWFDYRY